MSALQRLKDLLTTALLPHVHRGAQWVAVAQAEAQWVAVARAADADNIAMHSIITLHL